MSEASTTHPESCATPEDFREIDTSEFCELANTVIDDKSLPNRTTETTNPRPGAVVKEVITFGKGAYFQAWRQTEPAGEGALHPDRQVTILRVLAELAGERVEIQTTDGVLVMAVVFDTISQKNTDRQTSRKTFETALLNMQLALSALTGNY